MRCQELLADCFKLDVTKLSFSLNQLPHCELFHLLLADLFSISGLFTGYPSSVTAYHNLVALQNGDYRVTAKMVGLCRQVALFFMCSS